MTVGADRRPPVGGEPATADAESASPGGTITTIIFDVDDTLYDVSTGFTAHRNTDGATRFMVERLKFGSVEEAQALRDEYFAKYHATAKGLQIAESDGRLPPGAHFDAEDLSQWWADNLDFAILGGPDPKLIEMLKSLKAASPNLEFVAFSNGPTAYVARVLKEIGMEEFFPQDRVFAVNDVLPYAKPEPEAFLEVLNRVGKDTERNISPEQCVMVEDSMKNTRACKKLGMRTVLVAGRGRLHTAGAGADGGGGDSGKAAEAAEATKPGDAPDADDPAVDVAIEVCADLRDAVPGLWRDPPVFSTE